MSAFSYSNRYQIEQNLRALMTRRKELPGCELSFEEYIQTFVPATARQLFRDIAPHHGIRGYVNGRLRLEPFGGDREATLHINTTKLAGPPLVANLEPQPDAPPEVVERIRTWLENGGDVHRDFGRVLFVLNYLNENFSRAAMRHYWPTIMALCDAEPTQHLLAGLQANKVPATLKPLPAGMAALCRQTASTVATARLIPEINTGEQKLPSEVTISSAQGQTYKEHGFQFYALS